MEDNFNIHLGKKLRMRRLSLGLTQTKVAQAINVTFQQIQKYEKGTNGVSSNRLMQLSQFLKVPIIYFFEDFKEFKDINTNEDTNDDLNYSFLSRTFSSLSKLQKERILQKIGSIKKQIDALNNKLKNRAYLKNAPIEIVQNDKKLVKELTVEDEKLRSIVSSIN